MSKFNKLFTPVRIVNARFFFKIKNKPVSNKDIMELKSNIEKLLVEFSKKNDLESAKILHWEVK